jgi:two-component system, chemotaxis family, chemotaxis protein CheY
MKILIVDDDEITRFPLTSLASRLPGVEEVVEAADGEKAWELIQDGMRPHICCCDLHMPGLDGLGLLKRVKSDLLLKHIPFVMISSAADRASVTSAIEAGAVGFIVKPFSQATTSRTLERVLRESQAALQEPLADVTRRLGIHKSDVIRLMRKLQADISECLNPSGAPDAASGQVSDIKRIQGSCALLGLMHCANILRTAFEPAATPDIGVAALREADLQLTLVVQAATREL